MAEIKGADLLAKSLKDQGVEFMFGVVGFPVGPIAEAAQKVGLPYIGMRNEQAASYAAGAVGFLTGRPGSCIVVTGPGVIHGLSGLANAQQNCWPMILIGGASETYRNGMGCLPGRAPGAGRDPGQQMGARHRARQPHPVLCRDGGAAVDLRPPRRDLSRLPRRHDHRLVRHGQVVQVREMPRPAAHDGDAAGHRARARRAAIGAAPARPDRPGHGVFAAPSDEVRTFIEKTQIPFVRTPKGKGVHAGRPPAVGRRRAQPGAASRPTSSS